MLSVDGVHQGTTEHWTYDGQVDDHNHSNQKVGQRYELKAGERHTGSAFVTQGGPNTTSDDLRGGIELYINWLEVHIGGGAGYDNGSRCCCRVGREGEG